MSQSVRNALAYFLLTEQRQRFQVLEAIVMAHPIVSLSVDETEFVLNLQGARGSHSVMMLHGRIFRRGLDGSAHGQDIMIPPSVLGDETGVMAAMTKRAGWFYLAKGRHLSCSILNSDSAATLLIVVCLADHTMGKLEHNFNQPCPPNGGFRRGAALHPSVGVPVSRYPVSQYIIY